MIEIKDLMLFMEVYKTGSLTSAARNQKITQPAATFRLKKIEDDFKKPMFVRRSRGLEPTATGKMIANYAEVITEGYKNMYNIMQLLQEREEMTTIKVPENSTVTVETEKEEQTTEEQAPKRQILTEDMPAE